MKSVLFFIGSLKMGGSEKACIRMANALADDYRITILTMFGKGELEKEVSSKVKVRSVFPQFIRGVARISGYLPSEVVYRLYVREKFDIEIAVGDGLESHIIAGSPNPNKYSWVHMDLSVTGTRPGKKATKRYSAFRKIICVSNKCAAGFTQTHGLQEKTVVAYTPVDCDSIVHRAEMPVEFPANTFVVVGRLEYVKGIDVLIDAVAQIEQRDFQIYIYGDGTQRDMLQQMIYERQLEQQIVLKGQVDNPYPYIKGADALICPSRTESFGFAVVEAMLLQTPVLATRCGGTEEIISTPEEGLLCDCTAAGIAHGIEALLKRVTSIDVETACEKAMQYNVLACRNRFIEILER